MGVKLWWLLLIMLTFSHILITTYSHYNKIILFTAGLIFMYMAGTALVSLQALDLSSFLLNGYQVFSPRERRQNVKLSAQQTQKQKYTATQVKPSWHVDDDSLHIDIILLFQNWNLEIGLQTSHKLVCTSEQKATHIFLYISGRALDLLWALDLSSYLFNGYPDFTLAERRQNLKLSAQQSHLHPTKQKCTTTQVKTLWHVDKAFLHIAIIHLFPELEPGNRTANFTQGSLNQPAKAHTHTRARAHTHTHTHTHTHKHTHTHTHPHTHTHTQTHAHTNTHPHTHMHTCSHRHTQRHTHTDTLTQTHRHSHRHTHMHARTHTQTHTCTHTWTHTKTHTQTLRHTHTHKHTHTHMHT